MYGWDVDVGGTLHAVAEKVILRQLPTDDLRE
jgi:hypothetical protein